MLYRMLTAFAISILRFSTPLYSYRIELIVSASFSLAMTSS